jgi:hypothetical protein
LSGKTCENYRGRTWPYNRVTTDVNPSLAENPLLRITDFSSADPKHYGVTQDLCRVWVARPLAIVSVVWIFVNKSNKQQEISSFLAKSYVDRAREDFGDVSIQTQRHAFIAIVIRYTTVDDDVGNAALCGH